MLNRTSRLVATVALCLSFATGAAAATGSAVRTMKTERRIPEIVLQVIAGVVSDALPKLRDVVGGSGGAIQWPLLDVFTLSIDGQPRTGFWAWAGAAYRVAGYALNRGSGEGSVQYEYRLRIRGYDVRRSTWIEDGSVVLTTSTGWTERVPITKRVTREIPIYVQIRIAATTVGTQTLLAGTATGTSDTRGFSCPIVRRFAENRAASELDTGLADALATVQREGIRFYRGASDIAPILDGLRAGIELGGRLRP